MPVEIDYLFGRYLNHICLTYISICDSMGTINGRATGPNMKLENSIVDSPY